MGSRKTPHEYAAQIGARITALRKEHGLSLCELAEAAGLARGHLSAIERGLQVPTVVTLRALATALCLEPMHLLAIGESEDVQLLELLRQLPKRDVAKVHREARRQVMRS